MLKLLKSFKFNHLSNIPSHLGRFLPAAGFMATESEEEELKKASLFFKEKTNFTNLVHYVGELKKNYGVGSNLLDIPDGLAIHNHGFESFILIVFFVFFMAYTWFGDSSKLTNTNKRLLHLTAYKGTVIAIPVFGMFTSIEGLMALYKSFVNASLERPFLFKYSSQSDVAFISRLITGVDYETKVREDSFYSFAQFGFNKMLVMDHYTYFMKGVLCVCAFIFFFIFFRKVINNWFLNDRTIISNVDRFYYQVGLMSLLALFFLSTLISSNSLLSLFVSLEGATLCLYILAGLRSDKRLSVEAGLKYFLTSAVFSCIFGLGLFMIYFATGATDFLSIRESLLVLAEQGYNLNIGYFTYYTKLDYVALVGTLLVIVVFLMKLGSVPFHFWIGDIYQGSPIIVTTFFATVVRVSFFAVFFKLIIHTFFFVKPYLIPILFFSGVAAILVGSFLTLFQYEVKRFLANSSIVHTGFIVLGLSTMTFEGFKSSILYTIVYLFTLLCFLAIIVFYPVSSVRDYKKWGTIGLKKIDTMQVNVFAHLQQLPFGIKLFFAFLLFSMAGLPPFPGFIIKLYTLKAVFEKIAVEKLSYLSSTGDFSIMFNFGSNFL